MKHGAPAYMSLGAGVILVVSLGYALFGPKDFLGFPEPQWARFLFLPGTIAGCFTYEHFTHSMPVCYTVGIAAMTLVGAVFGALLDLLIGLGSTPRVPR